MYVYKCNIFFGFSNFPIKVDVKVQKQYTIVSTKIIDTKKHFIQQKIPIYIYIYPTKSAKTKLGYGVIFFIARSLWAIMFSSIQKYNS